MPSGMFQSDSPTGKILQHLQRHGPATIRELEQALGVSTTAVREQLAHLSELVDVQTVRRGSGRPHHVYSLSARAQSLFPKNYDELINLLLREILALDGAAKLDQILERVSERLAEQYSDQITGRELQQRLLEVRAALEARGIPAEAHTDAATLTLFSCPYFDVAQEHAGVCVMEQRMLEQLLGEKIDLQQTIRNGAQRCTFVVAREAQRGGNDARSSASE